MISSRGRKGKLYKKRRHHTGSKRGKQKGQRRYVAPMTRLITRKQGQRLAKKRAKAKAK